eukprot:g39507.t1
MGQSKEKASGVVATVGQRCLNEEAGEGAGEVKNFKDNVAVFGPQEVDGMANELEKGRILLSWKGFRKRFTKMLLRMEGLSYEERLDGLGLFSLQHRRLRGDLMEVYKIMRGIDKVSANGNVLRSEIVGSVKLRVFLSGMPELRLGLNDKVLFELTGHGDFELMSYRLNIHVSFCMFCLTEGVELRGDLIEVYIIMRGIDKVNGKSLFPRVEEFKTREHIFK